MDDQKGRTPTDLRPGTNGTIAFGVVGLGSAYISRLAHDTTVCVCFDQCKLVEKRRLRRARTPLAHPLSTITMSPVSSTQ